MSDDTKPDSDQPTRAEQRIIYVPDSPGSGDTVDLAALLKLVWARKWLIVVSTVLFSIVGAVYSLVAAPIYQVDVLLSVKSTGDQSSLPPGLSGVASVVGIDLGGSRNESESIATFRSRGFAEEFITANNLLPILFSEEWDADEGRWKAEIGDEIPQTYEGVTYFVEDVRSIAEDSTTGLVSLSIKWTDPDLAFIWAEDFVRRANQRLRSQDLESSERRLEYLNAELEKANLVELRTAIFGLIESEIQAKMFAQVEDEYVFKVIDPPRVPSKPVAPNKILIVFLAAFFGFAVAVFFILFSAAISYDPNSGVSA